MNRLFVVVVISYAFTIFGKDSKIEVIPVSVRTTLSKTQKLSGKKELGIINQTISVSNQNPCHMVGKPETFFFNLKIAFLGKFDYLEIKKITVDPIKTSKNKTIKLPSHGYGFRNGILIAEIFSDDPQISSFKEIKKIKGVAILKKYSIVKVEIKNILSMEEKEFTNDELQKKKIKLKFKNIEPNELKLAIISNKKPSADFHFTITATKTKTNGVSQPGFLEALGSGQITETVTDYPVSEEESLIPSGSIQHRVNGNEFFINKKRLSTKSSIKLKIMIPEGELKIPFCFENIPVPQGVKQ